MRYIDHEKPMQIHAEEQRFSERSGHVQEGKSSGTEAHRHRHSGTDQHRIFDAPSIFNFPPIDSRINGFAALALPDGEIVVSNEEGSLVINTGEPEENVDPEFRREVRELCNFIRKNPKESDEPEKIS